MCDKFSSKYNKKVIDLTFPLIPHWRYAMEIGEEMSFKKGNFLNTKHFNLKSHWYTHIDAPLHFTENGKSLDDFPIENLIGKAILLDLSYIKANEAITEKHLRHAVEGLELQDIIILKTTWDTKVDWKTKDYWDTAPYMTDEAAIYLRELKPKVVGFDFPQDYDIRRAGMIPEDKVDLTTHKHILKNDILMIEYLANLESIPESIFDFIGLPLAIPNADGAQIRAIALI